MDRPPLKTLVVSAKPDAAEFFSSVLPQERYCPIKYVSSAGEARRIMTETDYDIVIINAPLSDDPGIRLAEDLSRYEMSGIMLIVKAEQYEQVHYRAEDCGIAVLPKPVDRGEILRSLSILSSMHMCLIKMESKTVSLQQKMEEIKIVNRAKLLLMQKLGMSEQEAHRLIEKRAMDGCVKRIDIATELIDIYG